jgi:hypothetical protein
MRLTSVDAGESRIDSDGRPEDTREAPLRGRSLEARDPPAGVRAATRRSGGAAHELAVDGDEADELTLR